MYNLVHIGNARPYVTFAVLRSWLQRRGSTSRWSTNITDVDDKIINKADAGGPRRRGAWPPSTPPPT